MLLFHCQCRLSHGLEHEPTSDIFDRFRQYLRKTLVRIFAISAPLQFREGPLLWVRIEAVLPFSESLQELLEGNLIR